MDSLFICCSLEAFQPYGYLVGSVQVSANGVIKAVSQMLHDNNFNVIEQRRYYGNLTAEGMTLHQWEGSYIVADEVNGTVAGTYLRGIGLVATEQNDTLSYQVYNGHGDVVQLAGEDSAIEQQYDYDAYGNQREITGQETAPDANPFRYSGEYYDNETGYIYLRARYYDTKTGTFLSEDPIRDGNNWYGYCAGNPVLFIDPTGMFSIVDGIKVGILVAKAVKTAQAAVSASSAKTPASSSSPPKSGSSSSGNSSSSSASSKDQMTEFINAIADKESSNNYGIVNEHGYLGRYQFTPIALRDIGFTDTNNNWTDLASSYGVTSKETFLSTPRAQDIAMEMLLDKNWQYSRTKGMLEYIGQTMNDVEITVSGLLAASHLVGNEALRLAMLAGNLDDAKDGNQTPATEYMERFGGYYLEKYKP
jgi:RHS repeat-associated core domain